MWKFLSNMIFYLMVGLNSGGLVYLLILWIFQERFVFSPNMMRYPHMNPKGTKNPKEAGMDYEDLFLTTKDGTTIHCWFITQPIHLMGTRPTIVYFQSQSSNIGLRIPFANYLYQVCKANIMMVSYRGFGYSEGKPSEIGLYIDAQTAIKYLKSRSDIDQNKIFVYGSSLGTAVAVEMAFQKDNKLAGMILENPFIDLFSVAKFLMPILKFFSFLRFAFRFDMNNLKKISKIEIPLLIITASMDSIVPISHSKMLMMRSPSTKKSQVMVNSGHNEVWFEGGLSLARKIAGFITENEISQ